MSLYASTPRLERGSTNSKYVLLIGWKDRVP
jgi:hypothetical protein